VAETTDTVTVVSVDVTVGRIGAHQTHPHRDRDCESLREFDRGPTLVGVECRVRDADGYARTFTRRCFTRDLRIRCHPNVCRPIPVTEGTARRRR
jgi:hypothetical protein